MKLNTAPLSSIEYGIPTIADGVYFVRMITEKVGLKPNKAGTGNNVVVAVKVVDPVVMTREGKPVENRGQFEYSRYISLVSTAEYTPDKMLKELAIALAVPADKEDFELADIQGYCKAKIVYKKAEGQYPDGNEIKGFYPIKDSDNFTPTGL